MADFTPGRSQDASPAIRGFKYQIQLTLLRWLDLGGGDVLYLESGEDVDRVLRERDSAGVQRELEQIKVSGRKVTLRSTSVLTALANFAAHVKVNPNVSLRFRFTTTALPGREKLSPLAKGAKAIDAWQGLQSKREWTQADEAVARQVSEFIAMAQRPDDCPVTAWTTLTGILKGNGVLPFAEYLRRFEWCCGSASPEDLTTVLIDRLGELPGGTGPGDPSGRQRYDQLVAALLDLLSRDGDKILTRELLEASLAKPTLTAQDRTRLKLLEEQSASHASALLSLEESMRRLRSPQALPILFGLAADDLQAFDLSTHLPALPPLVPTLARRSATVSELAEGLSPGTWVALHGDFGMGKSHLGFLVAERHGGVTLGLSMRGLTAASAEYGLTGLVSNSAILTTIATATSGVVLLDDLPDIEPQSRFEIALLSFAKFAVSAGHRLLSTSRRALPSSLNAVFGSSLRNQATPPFSDDDANELFGAHGVPNHVLTRERVASMNSICGGHPMLLTALARHLLARPEKPDQALTEALLASTHRAQIDLETSRAVLDTVEVEACRNLLYRLASAGTAMTLDEIRVIAGITPPLAEPTGCVARLDGLWLRRTADSRYEVSPLTTPLWREVPETINKDLHGEVANLIFRRRRLSVTEFVRAITSFLIAGRQDSAAAHLLHGCLTWPNKTLGYAHLGVLLFFPLDRDHSLRPPNEIPIRAAQAVTAALEGTDVIPYITRIEGLIKEATLPIAASAVLAGSMILLSPLERIPMRLAVLGASLVERFRNVGKLAKATSDFPDHVHLLLPTAAIRNWDDLDAFIELLRLLSAERRNAFMSTAELKEGMQVIVFRPLFDASGGLTNAAFARLTEIEDECAELGLSVLGAHAASAKLIVLGEYEKNLDGMLAEADRARKRFATDAIALSVIDAMTGQQLYLNKRPIDGLRLLSKGLADPSHIVGLERASRLVDALSAAWDADEDAGPFTDQLAALLRDEEFHTPEGLCQMHSQIALVRWRQKRRHEAFGHLEKGVVHFLELEDSSRARQLGTGLAHVIHYCVSIAESGAPPPTASDGGPYAEGRPQMFSGANQGMAGMWKVRQGPAMLQWVLGRLATALGLHNAASSWTDRALDAATESKSAVLLTLLIPRATAASLRASAWASAIDAAITHGRARVFLEELHQRGSSVVDESASFDPFDLPHDEATAQKAEKYSLWLLSLLIVNELCARVFDADDSSRADLNSLSGALAEFAARSHLPSAWQAMADAVRLSASDRMLDQQHKDLLAESNETGSNSARFVAHGLLALRSDVRFGQAVISQIGALQELSVESKALEIPPDTYARTISKFWEDVSSRAPFRFALPRELAKTIATAPILPPLPRSKAILRAVLYALPAKASAESRDWLGQTS